jgi:hypothetical protein
MVFMLFLNFRYTDLLRYIGMPVNLNPPRTNEDDLGDEPRVL